MNFFVVFTYSPFEVSRIDFGEMNRLFAELGLRNAVKDAEGEKKNLPTFTFIGEYNNCDKEELKNILYSEIKNVFAERNLNASIFIAVTEKASIGIELLDFDRR